MKFGGSFLTSAQAFLRVASIVNEFKDRKPIVVVSAMRGVTDLLLDAFEEHKRGGIDAGEGALAQVLELYGSTAREIASQGRGGGGLVHEIEGLLSQLSEEVTAPVVNEEAEPRIKDRILSYGEHMSALMLGQVLWVIHDIEAHFCDARDFIFTDYNYGAANIEYVRTNKAARSTIRACIDCGGVPVVNGFSGSAPDGSTTTLGRDGSDLTATVVGGANDVDEIWFWKDTDGAMTADPNVVPEASFIPNMTYDEAAGMTAFGSQFLHSSTLIPITRKRIPVRIKNASRLDWPGTVIGPEADAPVSGVRGVTAVNPVAVIAVVGKGMADMPGIAEEVFAAARSVGASIKLISQPASEQSICMACAVSDADDLGRRLRELLKEHIAAKRIERVEVFRGYAAVAIVGEGMKGTPGIAGRLFTSVGDIGVSVNAIAQDFLEQNISFIVPDTHVDDVVRAVHEAFGLHETVMEEDDEQ
jgi:aspartate kinase